MPRVRDIKATLKKPDKLLTIKEDSSITEAAKIMSDHQVGCLLVFDDNEKFTGVLSERDLMSEILTKYSLENTPVKDIMTKDIISCDRTTDIEEFRETYGKTQDTSRSHHGKRFACKYDFKQRHNRLSDSYK